MDGKNILINVKRVIIISIIISLAIAILEIITSIITDSLALLADGFDAIGNAIVSFIVLIGLVMSNKRPDDVFNFGYYKVENLASFLAAFVSIIMASYVAYFSILSIVGKHIVYNSNLAIAVVAIAFIPSLAISIYKIKFAQKIGFLSVKADAINSFKDSLGSITAIIGLYFVTIGFTIFDSIAAIIISGLIVALSFFVLKESTYILLDACKNPELRNLIIELAKGIPYITKVIDVRMRRLGTIIHTEVEVEFDENITVKNMREAIKAYEERIKKVISGVTNVNVIIKY